MMTPTLISSFIVMGLVLQLVMFFKSCRRAFYAFLSAAAVQLLALGVFWYENYQSYLLLDNFLEPIVAQFDGPQPLSEGLTLQDIAQEGRKLTHTYLASARESIPSSSTVIALSCRGQVRVSALALGAVLEHVYVLDGAEAARYRVTLQGCFSNG